MFEVHLNGAGVEGEGIDIIINRFPFLIGRCLDCDLRLDHEYVSRRHCCFLLRGDELWIHDLLSTNGTFLNGKRIEAVPQVVREHDLIALAPFRFRVSFAFGDKAPAGLWSGTHNPKNEYVCFNTAPP
jgi:pSer/pThr/pTyr-binding forkhead associated (FHA) protein